MKPLAAVPRAILPLTLLAAALALVAPSHWVADRSDVLLAALVLATALAIPARELLALRARAGTVIVLSVAPLLVLAALGWALSRAFDGATRDGLLALGLSSTEVASVGLTALAGADATIALGAVTGSLVLAALAGPAAIGRLAGGHGHGGAGHLLVRFALVVIVPLAVGVAVRSLERPGAWLAQRDDERDGLATLAVVMLVYGSLSGADGAHGLGTALVAAIAFLAVSAVLGGLWHAHAPGPGTATPGALAIAMRDFAVAAALASQAFGTRAATVPGIYGALMLVAGSAFVTIARRRRPAA